MGYDYVDAEGYPRARHTGETHAVITNLTSKAQTHARDTDALTAHTQPIYLPTHLYISLTIFMWVMCDVGCP
jgi:hypothetical protein